MSQQPLTAPPDPGFRRLAENSPDSVMRYDREGRILYLNRKLACDLAVTQEGPLGRTPGEVWPDGRFAEIEAAVLHTARTGEATTVELHHAPASGVWIHSEIRVVAERDEEGRVVGALAFGRDMSDAHATQEALAAREQEFRSLAENSPDNIIRYDRECRQVYANPPVRETMMQLLGRDPMGETPNQAYPDGSFRDYDAALRRVMASGRMEEFEFQLPDRCAGVQHHQIRMAAERDAAGQVVGVVAIGRDITAIRESERQLRHFVDNLPGLAFTFRQTPDGRGSFPFVSASIKAIYGVSPEAVQADMAPIHDLTHPDDRPRIEAAIARSARTLTPIRIEFRVCRPGRPERWLEVRSVPIRQRDGATLWYGIMPDITERKRTEQALADRTAQLCHEHAFIDTILDTQPALVVVLDARGRLVHFNQACETLTGYDLAALQGERGWWDLIPAEERAALEGRIIAPLHGGAPLVEHEGHLLCRDGARRLVAWRSAALRDEGGGLHFIIATGIDVTDQRRAEAEAREHLEEASRLQRIQTANELATVLAHEINQPLAAITTYADAGRTLMRQPHPDLRRVADTLERIARQALRAGEIIRHLRRFVGRGRVEPVPMELDEVVRRACGLLAARAQVAGIRLEIDAEPGLPLVLGVDVQVEQVLLNLLRNALEAIRDGGVRDGRIRVSLRRAGATTQVTVQDNGPGIDAEIADRLFAPFSSTKADGLGVGLRISRSLIKAHGGRLWLEPPQGEPQPESHRLGGCFHFTLPIAPIAP